MGDCMAERNINVITIAGSLRKGSYNAALARELPKYAPSGMTITAAPSWAGFPVYNADVQAQSGFPADVQALGEAIRAADAVIICTPEYNYGIPGPLKNALDWVSRLDNQPFKNKPVALQSTSPGPLGGARVQYQMRQVMVFMEAFVFTRPEIFIGGYAAKFNEQLELTDKPTIDFVTQQLAAFAGYIERLKH